MYHARSRWRPSIAPGNDFFYDGSNHDRLNRGFHNDTFSGGEDN
jgi:hypothetical protein